MPGRALTSLILAVVGLLVCSLLTEPATATVSDGFGDEVVVDKVSSPTALAFTPDGNLLVASRPGLLHLFDQNGTALSSPALDISTRVCSGETERGLLGVAVDPNFESQGSNFVYVYYTFKKHGVCPARKPGSRRNPVNRVSRFVVSGNTIHPDSEEVLIDNIPSPNGNHNAGDLHFGPDDLLYVSVGDGGCHFVKPNRCQYENGAARARHVLLGKILRITPDGGIPPTNPFVDEPSEPCGVDGGDGRTVRGNTCQETFALGFRNPFRFAIDPDEPAMRLYVNDVGGNKREEIDAVEAGGDYGWNLCEGTLDNRDRRGKVNCDGDNYRGPIHEYSHTTGCRSITGGAFVPEGTSWPGVSDEAYLFGDFICGEIFELTPDGAGGITKEQFASGLGPGPISMTFGPNGTGEALYYTTFEGDVHRIVSTG